MPVTGNPGGRPANQMLEVEQTGQFPKGPKMEATLSEEGLAGNAQMTPCGAGVTTDKPRKA